MFSAEIDDPEAAWLPDLDFVFEIHDAILESGQLPGTLGPDHEGYLEAALARPRNAFIYGGVSDIITLATYLWHGLSEAHGFRDGNKRTATMVALSFLEANGVTLHKSVPSGEPGRMVDALHKAGTFTQENLDSYLRTRCVWIVED